MPQLEGARGTTSSPQAGGVSLNAILNILWRWRLLVLLGPFTGLVIGLVYGAVVTPLHIATTTVQPGITMYNERGLAEREWRVTDIVQWYKRGDFNPALAERLGENPRTFRPIIRTAYVPRGPQSPGGRTITLSTLFPDREMARRVLDGSIEVFNEFASADSATSDIALMRVRIDANIERQRAKIQDVETKQLRVGLQIESAGADRTKLEASKQLVRLQIEELERAQELVMANLQSYERITDAVRGGLDSLNARLDQRESEANRLEQRRDQLMGSGTVDPMTLLLYSENVSSLVGDVGRLRLGVFDQNERILEWADRIATLRREIDELERQIEEQRYELEQTIPRELFELEQQIRELELERDRDLPHEALDLGAELRTMESRLGSLSSLEQIGESRASVRPVRPRKSRATMILVVLGLASALFSAFVLDYLVRNWGEITRSGSGA